jgi:hypothetical protein
VVPDLVTHLRWSEAYGGRSARLSSTGLTSQPIERCGC